MKTSILIQFSMSYQRMSRDLDVEAGCKRYTIPSSVSPLESRNFLWHAIMLPVSLLLSVYCRELLDVNMGTEEGAQPHLAQCHTKTFTFTSCRIM